jgi:hypothetical protein
MTDESQREDALAPRGNDDDDEISGEDESSGPRGKLDVWSARGAGRNAGVVVASWITGLIAAVGGFVVGLLTRLVPYGGRFWKALAVMSVERYHRVAGGDAVGVNLKQSGKVDLEPVAYRPADIEDQKRAGWQAAGRDKAWEASADGREVDRLGKAPVVFLDESASQRATAVEARVAEAIDLGRFREVLDAQNVQVVKEIVMPEAGDGQGDAAVADGGTVEENTRLEDATIDAIQDVIVDITPDGDYDGQAISMRKVKETYRQKADGEKMEEAKTYGYLAGMSMHDNRGMVIKILLIALAMIMAATMGPTLIQVLFGGGGGSAGSSFPISIAPLWGA